MRGELFAGDRPFYITIPEAAILRCQRKRRGPQFEVKVIAYAMNICYARITLIDEEANKW